MYHERYTILLNEYAPLKKLSKKETKLRNKPWLSKALLNSISKKEPYFTNLKTTKPKTKTQVLHTKNTKNVMIL